MAEFELRTRNEILLELKDCFYFMRMSTEKSETLLTHIRDLMWVLSIEGFANKKTENRIDEILEKEGLKVENDFMSYWNY